jgi:hypothetical protein
VPAGVRHSRGKRRIGPEIVAVVELCPALRTKELRKAFAGLVADGRTSPGVRRRTRASSAPPSGTSATKAG